MADMRLPGFVADVMLRLSRHGYEAWAVGGCVRDTLLGRPVRDYDLATSALPEQVAGLFARVLMTGLRYGTVTVLGDGMSVEVTTMRSDGAYADGRRPQEVRYGVSIEDDLRRRDFTINAMAWSPGRGIFDPFGGAGDLKRGVIRCVGDPALRFGEDALRILRAYRFMSQLGFELDADTRDAARGLAPSLCGISAERRTQELVKMLAGLRPDVVFDAIGDGCFAADGLTPLPPMRAPGSLAALAQELRLSGLCAVIARSRGMDTARGFASALRLPARAAKHALNVACDANEPLPADRLGLKRRMAHRGLINTRDALIVRRDALGDDVAGLPAQLGDIVASGECWRVDQLQITGERLISMGLRGSGVGKCLRSLLEHCIERPCDNTPERLEALAREMMR